MNRLLCYLLFAGLVGAMSLPNHVYGQEVSTFFLETFDGVTPPDLPAGWSDTEMRWESSSSVSSTGSGLNNIRISGTTPGAVQSSAIDLSGMTSGTLQYLVRRTSSYAQDSMVVKTSADGGISFSLLLDKGSALPAVDSEYELISVAIPSELIGVSDVLIMFEALGGSTSGANIRIDDVEIIGEGEPVETESTFGFAAASSSADPVSGLFEVPLFLDFNDVELLQGIQFSIDWNEGIFDLSDITRGSAIANTEEWQLNYNARDGELRVVLLGDPASALANGLYDPLMTLQFAVDAGNTASESVLTLSSVLGALSVRTGDSADLNLGLSTHTVSLTTGGGAVFSPDVLSLDAGIVSIDVQGTSVLTVSNTGTSDLVISDVMANNVLYAVTPASATITPGVNQAFTVTFSPVFTSFGFQASDLTFTHNAAGGSDVIGISGTGTGGLGDMSEDGLVDVVDLVLGIDYVLENLIPSDSQLPSADVFPYSAADGVIDVRDLTVLSQAILLGVWPDELPVPEPAPAAGKSDDAQSAVRLQPVVEGGSTVVYLQVDTPIRAFQFALELPASNEVLLLADEVSAAGINPQMYSDDKGVVRFLGARLDGLTLQPGRYPLVLFSNLKDASTLHLGYALSVDGEGNRLPLGMATAVASGVEALADKPLLEVYRPYPNPFFKQQSGDLQVPFHLGESQHVEVEVFDILGRLVSVLANHTMNQGQHSVKWNGTDTHGGSVAPGLYLVKIKAGSRQESSVVVLR